MGRGGDLVTWNLDPSPVPVSHITTSTISPTNPHFLPALHSDKTHSLFNNNRNKRIPNNGHAAIIGIRPSKAERPKAALGGRGQ